MVLFLTILIAFISVVLIIFILMQNPKGGGLSSTFGGSQAAHQIMGAANSTDFLEKVTWALAGSLLVLCIVTGVFFKGDGTAGNTSPDAKLPVSTTTVPTAPQPQPQPLPQGQ